MPDMTPRTHNAACVPMCATERAEHERRRTLRQRIMSCTQRPPQGAHTPQAVLRARGALRAIRQLNHEDCVVPQRRPSSCGSVNAARPADARSGAMLAALRNDALERS